MSESTSFSEERVIDLDVRRWDTRLDDADMALLERCVGATLDIGCGPGRLVAELTAQGVPSLGVDVAHWAVRRTRSIGAAALHRSVFDRIPGTGLWGTALLADGNVGIGGNPASLFERVAELLRPSGLLLCEVEVDEVDERLMMRLAALDGSLTSPVPWARVGLAAAQRDLVELGYELEGSWSTGGRRFLAARTASAPVRTATVTTLRSRPRG